MKLALTTVIVLSCAVPASSLGTTKARAGEAGAEEKPNEHFPPPESKGGWRKLDRPDQIRRLGGMDTARLDELKRWLLNSDKRDFAAVVIRRGFVVLEVERGNSAKTDSRRVASVSKAVCATVLAISPLKNGLFFAIRPPGRRSAPEAF